MKKILLIVIFLNFFCLSAFAEELSFEEVLESSVLNSYKLKVSKYEKQIANKTIKEAISAYYPTMNAFGMTERYNDLTDGNSQITAVGNEIFLNRSYYQDMAAVGFSYKIWDFGERHNHLNIAKFDVLEKDYLLAKEFRDLHFSIVELYSEALMLYKSIKIKTEVLNLQNELVEINSRLQDAGELSSVELFDSKINSAKVVAELDELKNSFAKKISEITYYTNKKYDDELSLLDFSLDYNVLLKNIENIKFRVENLPEIKIADLEIRKKQSEYEIQKRINYPKIRFDTRYNFYGSDATNFFNGVRDISQRSITLRVSASMVLFDGFKNLNSISKKKLEIEKMKIEKEMQIAELKKKYEQLIIDAKNSVNKIKHFGEILLLVNQNLDNLERLNENGFASRADFINRKIELLKQKEEYEQSSIENLVLLYKLNISLESLL